MSFEIYSIELGNLLASVIRLNRYRTIVEVGVAFGTTTKYLCAAARDVGGTVYGFDVWATHGKWGQFVAFSSKEEVERRLFEGGFTNFKLTKINTAAQDFSQHVKNLGPIDFAFIDADHSYDGIANDFWAVYPQLSSGGTVCFHDTLRIDGCREFVIDLRTKFNDGTFDIVEFPWGNGDRRVGISLLVKRSFPMVGIPIDEICGSPSSPDQIYEKERQWYRSETEAAKKTQV